MIRVRVNTECVTMIEFPEATHYDIKETGLSLFSKENYLIASFNPGFWISVENLEEKKEGNVSND